MSTDEQGPDTAIENEIRLWVEHEPARGTLNKDVAFPLGLLSAARTERDRLRELLDKQTARLDFTANKSMDTAEGLRAELAAVQAAVVTARRDALTATADLLERTANVGWTTIGREELVMWLRARASTQTPEPAECGGWKGESHESQMNRRGECSMCGDWQAR